MSLARALPSAALMLVSVLLALGLLSLGLLSLGLPAAASPPDRSLSNGWQDTLDRVVPSVVVMRVSVPRSFDHVG